MYSVPSGMEQLRRKQAAELAKAAAHRVQQAEIGAARAAQHAQRSGLQQPMGVNRNISTFVSGGAGRGPSGNVRWPISETSGRVFHAPREVQRDAPCHPIGMSKVEADAEDLIAKAETSAKRTRADDETARQLQPLLASVETELLSTQQQLAREQAVRNGLAARLEQLRQGTEQVQREYRQKLIQLQHGNPETRRKLEKYKVKLEKGEQHERSLQLQDSERLSGALRRGIEQCSDAEARLLASRGSALTPAEARQLLGVPDAASAAAAAKKLMAKLHPDRVHVEACKDGVRRRFQLVQGARDVLIPPT